MFVGHGEGSLVQSYLVANLMTSHDSGTFRQYSLQQSANPLSQWTWWSFVDIVAQLLFNVRLAAESEISFCCQEMNLCDAMNFLVRFERHLRRFAEAILLKPNQCEPEVRVAFRRRGRECLSKRSLGEIQLLRCHVAVTDHVVRCRILGINQQSFTKLSYRFGTAFP